MFGFLLVQHLGDNSVNQHKVEGRYTKWYG